MCNIYVWCEIFHAIKDTHTHTFTAVLQFPVWEYTVTFPVWRLLPTFYCRGNLWTRREPFLVILVRRLHSYKQFDYSRAHGCLYAPWLPFIILLLFFGKRGRMWHCGHVAVRGQLEESILSFSHVASRIELSPSGWAAGAFTPWAVSLASFPEILSFQFTSQMPRHFLPNIRMS